MIHPRLSVFIHLCCLKGKVALGGVVLFRSEAAGVEVLNGTVTIIPAWQRLRNFFIQVCRKKKNEKAAKKNGLSVTRVRCQS